MSKVSYHDLEVTFGVPPATRRMMNLPFAYEIRCSRATGWQLWAHEEQGVRDSAELVGGEYDDAPLRLELNGCVIVDSYDRAAAGEE